MKSWSQGAKESESVQNYHRNVPTLAHNQRISQSVQKTDKLTVAAQ